jgi:predicted metal-dependent hydrolase
MEYVIRRNPRARHVWLRFDRDGGLIVVVPRRFDARRVPEIVQSNHEWIQRHAERVASRREARGIASPVSLPEVVVLTSIGQEWMVEYRETSATRVRVMEGGVGRIIVVGAIADTEACRMALWRWLRRTAHRCLSPMLCELARENGFATPRLTVRSQRTRWASCSRNGAISLNVRLLFVAPELVRHVMLHELCHTRRMDHSAQFWSLLEGLDPGWKEHRHRLRAAWHLVPTWLIAKSVCQLELATVNTVVVS